MTDLEITKLCGKAMGLELVQFSGHKADGYWSMETHRYRPLSDDAQAMALVKKLGLDIQHYYWDDPLVSKHDAHGKLLGEARNKDLNRAIVECVAQMQSAKVLA